MSKRSDFRLIGDPHITRKFEFGVPLPRKGEREASLFADFKNRLYQGDERIVIMVGDLFERPICSLKDLFNTANIILDAAQSQPQRLFFMMCGNHDISPQRDNPGAFDILKLFDGMLHNLFIVNKPMVYEKIAFLPWEWERISEEQLDDLEGESFDVAVGHWDLVSYDEHHTDHLCPAEKLVQMGAESLYSGHWHIAGDYKVEGHTVHCTGSMQPMTHAEDPESKLYVTMSLEDYEKADPETLKDKYVRVVAPEGAEVDSLENCLGFKVQRAATESGEEDRYDVEIGEFKVSDIIENNLKKHEVPAEVGAFIKERIDADA